MTDEDFPGPTPKSRAFRAAQPEYRQVAGLNYDESNAHRGVWMRCPPGRNWIELCSGRDGDDNYVLLRSGDTLTPQTISAIEDCLRTGAWLLSLELDNIMARAHCHHAPQAPASREVWAATAHLYGEEYAALRKKQAMEAVRDG